MDRIKKIALIREKLKNSYTLGTWMQIPNSTVAEIIGNAKGKEGTI